MCSELTPRAPVPDNRIPQLMRPCAATSSKKRKIFQGSFDRWNCHCSCHFKSSVWNRKANRQWFTKIVAPDSQDRNSQMLKIKTDISKPPESIKRAKGLWLSFGTWRLYTSPSDFYKSKLISYSQVKFYNLCTSLKTASEIINILKPHLENISWTMLTTHWDIHATSSHSGQSSSTISGIFAKGFDLYE